MRKLLFWFRRDQLQQELAAELDLHVHLMEMAHAERGSEPSVTKAECRRAMGNITLAKEESRDMWSFLSLEHFLHDVRYALRVLVKNPGFSIIAILSLALGIAGNTAIFSIINALLIRPLPFQEPNRLVRVTGLYPKAIFEYFQQRSNTMEIAIVDPGSELNLTGQGPAVRVTASETSANFFSVLGAAVARGRVFEQGEDRPGRDGVAILSHDLWKTQFREDPNIIGRTITLGGMNRRVIGVTPENFAYPSRKVQLWIPTRIDPAVQTTYWAGLFAPLIGRLQPGVRIEQARAEIHSLASGVWKLFPWPMPRHWNADSQVISLQTDLAGETRRKLFVLLGAVGTVLLIACANVASLLLARATTRRKEIAMRAALGAGGGRIVRQLLTESVVLAIGAGVAGLVLGTAALSIFRFIVPPDTPGIDQMGIDWRVTAFAGGLSILTGLLFGVAPALNARSLDLVDAMKTGSGRGATATWMTLRSWLIAGEIALTLVLVVGAGLLIKSLYDLTAVNPGFSPQNVLTIKISPNDSLCRRREACIALYDRLLDQVRGLSGVTGAALANTVPLDGQLPSIPTDVEDHPRTADFPSPMLWAGAITPNYLRFMHIPLISGREFTPSDGPSAPPVIVVSASTAKRFWPGISPIGKHIRRAPDTGWRTIVGVVADVKQFSLADNTAGPGGISGSIYMPYAQAVTGDGQIPVVMNLLVKTSARPEQAGADIRRIALGTNPDIPVGKIQSLTEIVGDSISGFRSTMWVFLSFAGTALLLAAVGLYGLMSYSVSQRAYEISVRMAIGARTASVVGLILSQSLRITSLGMVAGVVVSFVVTRFLSSLLFGVTATDPLTFGGVSLLLLFVAIAASSVPAWRAACIDPIRTLRAE